MREREGEEYISNYFSSHLSSLTFLRAETVNFTGFIVTPGVSEGFPNLKLSSPEPATPIEPIAGDRKLGKRVSCVRNKKKKKKKKKKREGERESGVSVCGSI